MGTLKYTLSESCNDRPTGDTHNYRDIRRQGLAVEKSACDPKGISRIARVAPGPCFFKLLPH